MGVEAEIEIEQIRVRPAGSEVQRLCASNSKATKLLGWSPMLQGAEGLHEGLKKTIDWFSDPVQLARYKADRYNF